MLNRAELREVTLLFNSHHGAALEAEVRALLYRALVAHGSPVDVFRTVVITATRIKYYEGVRREAVRRMREAAQAAANEGRAGDRELAREKNAEKERWTELRFLGETAARALRSLNDAIAWRAMRYDRATIEVLVGHRPTGALVSGDALVHELISMAEEQELLDPEYYVLWNDATNFLRHGDYTVVERDSGRVVDIREVTTGSTSSARKQRQAHRISEAVRLATGEALIRDGVLQQRLIAPVAVETHVGAVAQVIDAAARHGIAAFAPSDYFAVTAVDLPMLARRPDDEALRLIDEANNRVRAVAESENAVATTSYLHHVDFPRNAAPWGIYPAAPAARARVITGAIEVTRHFSFSAWFGAVRKAGWQVWVPASWPRHRDYREVPRIARGPMSMQLSASLLGRMTTEGLSPSTAIGAAQWLAGARQSLAITLGFEDDWQDWQ